MVDYSGVACTLRLDGEHADYPAQIAAILTTLPVQDVEIRNPDIESIIRQMYLDEG